MASRRRAAIAARVAVTHRPGAPALTQRERVAWLALLFAAIVAGGVSRGYQLGIQIILDDEWHALHKLLASDAWGIFTSFGYSDYSIPLTLYDRLLFLHGGLTEWAMHLPMLLSGVALLAAAPLLLRHETTPPVRATWVALLAVSPLLVYHTRVARPYALTSLLTLLALVAFRRWWLRQGSVVGWGATYAIAAALAGWLHLVTLPFTLLPFAYSGVPALVALARERQLAARAAALSRLSLLALVTALPLAAVLLPPLRNDWANVTAKIAADSVTLDSAYRTLLMLYGVAQPAWLVALAALTGLGIARFWQRDRAFVGYVAVVTLGAAIAIALAHSPWIHEPLVLARYLIPALPFALLFLAEGLVACLALLRRPALEALVAAALVASLVYLGPIPGYLYYPNQFMGHLRFQFDYDPAHNPYVQLIPKEPVPEFYRTLARQPPATITLIEAPWRLESHFDPYPWYQQVHRQYVKIGFVTPVCGERSFGEYPASAKGMRMREFVHLSEVLAGESYGADYLVMHLAPWTTPPGQKIEWPDVTACLPAIEAKVGAPVYGDGQIVVFALKARRPVFSSASGSPAVPREWSSRARTRNAATPSDSRAPSPVWARR
jgi:hypothetical protein